MGCRLGNHNSGQESKRVYHRRVGLVRKGLASWFQVYHSTEELEKRLTL